MELETITYEVADRIATITLNRPDQLNALSPAMVAELRGVYEAAEADDEVWILVITANGRGFCTAADASEIRVVDPGSGAVLAPGDTGEIRVRGRNVMRGICGRTRDTVFDADGFYPTGDLGRLDGAGYLWFEGRLDDMFKVSGATVYPAEVESAIRGIDAVRHVHVTNVSDAAEPDAVGALVVTDLPLEELVAVVRSQLSTFKVPTRWVLTNSADDVPLTATSKVDKVALQDLLRRDGKRAEPVRADHIKESGT